MQNTIEQLNFEVILNTKQFDATIKSVEERAKNFNTSLSQSLDIQKNVDRVMNSTARASARSAAERDKESQSFSKYIDQLRKMEEQGQRVAAQMPKAFNWSHHIDQTYLELNRLMGILEKIQERQASGARVQYSNEYVNKITAAGEGALRAITALEEAQKRLTAPNNGFQDHIRNLTQTNTTLLQMREHYSALEKDSQRAAKETEKMYASQAKATKEAQKQLPVGRSMESMAAERAAIEKRIAENLANEGKELSKIKTAEGTRAADARVVADAQQKVNKLIEEATKKQAQHRAEVVKTTNSLMSARSILSTISQLTGVYFGAMGARRFLSSMIEITGQFEVQRMALRNMLQDVDGADKIFEDLYHFASDSTYRFSELAKYAKQLAAFNINKSNLLETTKMLGDVASGVGVSMDRLILAYGHVKSSGFLRGIQLRSFSQNGVPILEELSKMFTEIEGKAVSLGDVFDKMMKREIPFEMVEEAFRRMTSEGGKFYQMQEVLARTLSGQINILKGRWENLLAAIGQANSGVLKDSVAWMNDLVANMDNFGRLIKQLIVGFSAYQVALVAAVAVTNGFTAALNVGVLGALKKVAVAIAANPFAVLATAVAAASVVIYGLITALSNAEKIHNSLAKSINNFNDAVSSEIGELDALYAKLKLARQGTDEYDAAKRAIISRFGPYIDQLRSEGVEVNNLSGIYQNLAEKIREANKEKFLETSLQDLSSEWNAAEKSLRTSFNKVVSDMGESLGRELTEIQKQSLWRFVTGTVTDENRLIVDSVMSNLQHNLEHTSKLVNPKNATFGPHYMAAEQKQNALGLMKDLRSIAKDYQEASNAYADTVVEAHKAFDVLEKGTGKSSGNNEDASELEYRVSSIIEGIKKVDAAIDDIRKKARKGSITQSEKDKLDALISEREDLAKQYQDIMGVKYDKDLRNNAKGEKAAEKIVRESIAEIKGEISLLEKYKSAYDKLEPVFGAEAARAWVFNNMGKDVSNLDEEIQKLIEDLRKMGEEGAEAADSIEAQLGLDAVNKVIKAKQEADKAQKALQKYQDTYHKWSSEDFNLGGTGFEFDIRKALSDLKTKFGEIDEKYIRALREAEEAYRGDAEAIAEAREQLEGLRDAEKDYERTKSQESLGKLATSYLKDQYLLHNIDFDDLSQKTVGQLRSLKKELVAVGEEAKRTLSGNFTYLESLISSWGYNIDDLTDESLESLNEMLPESARETLRFMIAMRNAGLSVDDLGEKINSALKKGLKDLDEEEEKALASLAKNTAKQIISLADSFEELGEATENAHLAQAASDIAFIGKAVQSAAEGFRSGGWIGAIVGAFVSVTDQIVNAAAIAAEKERELRDAIREVQIEVKSASFDNLLSNGVDTIFGSDFIKNIRNAIDGIAKVREQLNSLDEWMRNFREEAKKDPLFHQGGYLNLLFGDDVENTLIHTKHSRWTATDEYATIEHLAEELGYDSIKDKYNNLNPELLEDILELYGDLNEELKDWLANSAEYSKEYAKAMEQIEEATKSVFDNLASDMADEFIDNFLQMGNAVDDLSDTFANLGDAILHSFLQSYILEEILNKYTEDANEALGKYANNEMTPEDYAAWLDGFADNIQKESETLAPAINGMIEAFKDRGLMNIDENTANSLGSGIKGITEDTANLLASYINAIRDDVSNIRRMQETGWESINMLGSSVPTLNEYLAQIAATNFDIAQSNQSILSEIRSVIGAPGTSGMVVRVEGF